MQRLLTVFFVSLVFSSATSSSTFAEMAKAPGLLDFASLPRLTAPALSPTGKYLSALVNDKDKRVLLIRDLDNANKKPYLISGRDWKIHRRMWVSPKDLLLGISIPETLNGVPLVVTRLVHVDVEKQKQRLLFKREESQGFFQMQDRVLTKVANKAGHFLIAAGKSDPARPQVFQADIADRRLSSKVVQRHISGVLDWLADSTGIVRVGIGITRDQKQGVLKLRDESGKWRDYSHLLDRGAEVLAIPSHMPNHYFISMSSLPSDTEDADTDTQSMRQVYAVDVRSGEEQWRYGREDSEVAYLQLDERGEEVFELGYSNEELEPEVFDAEWRAVRDALLGEFPNAKSYLAAVAEDRSRAVVGVGSDTMPNQYYLYDSVDRRMARISVSYPNLNQSNLSPVLDVTYRARDGLKIPGYLTLPYGVSLETARNLPFVIHPHGGPHARDFKRFDWLVQMLASQGYGVLQMNFRGSTGYGLAFEEAGYRQWGQAMQDDITDGTRWIIDEEMADPRRICIMGGSYGGYAALMGVAKEANLYQCAISLNGVSDLPSLIRLQQRFIGGRFATRFVGDLWKDRSALKDNSPLRLVEQIKVPVLLVHGEKDRVVSVRQSRAMYKTMQQKSKAEVRYLELLDGDHFLSNYQNRIAFAQAATEFLSQNLQ